LASSFAPFHSKSIREHSGIQYELKSEAHCGADNCVASQGRTIAHRGRRPTATS
jgi:hypothetical protein